MKWRIFFLSLFFSVTTFANKHQVTVYTWSGEIPEKIIKQFEKETGITVNYSSFDNNEVMFAKLRTNRKGYDIVEPSSYYIARMQRQNMLEKLDLNKLSNLKNINPFFLNTPYDPHNQYSIPFIWGITGIVVNKDYYKINIIKKWSDLLSPQFNNQIMLLDEARAVFSAGMLIEKISLNSKNPRDIKRANDSLKKLMPNIRLFNSDAVISILIDEDATLAMAWNGDFFKAYQENPKLQFVIPEDGFEIWVDNFVILKNAPHRENAYRFINFMLRPDIAKKVSEHTFYSSTNFEAVKLMPEKIRFNPVLYPPLSVLARGEFQSDVGDQATDLIEKYWEFLKMGGV